MGKMYISYVTSLAFWEVKKQTNKKEKAKWQRKGTWAVFAGFLKHGSGPLTGGWKLCYLDNEIQEGLC